MNSVFFYFHVHHKIRMHPQQCSSRLMLVLDIDNTLLHSSTDNEIHEGMPDVHIFTAECNTFHVKLRPHLRWFLDTMEGLFHMAIYTAGTYCYAKHIEKIIDPDGRYFKGRVYSARDHREGVKSLYNLLPLDAIDHTIVLDDRIDVWDRTQHRHILPVRPYVYWKSGIDYNDVPGAIFGQIPNAGVNAGHHQPGLEKVERDCQLVCSGETLARIYFHHFTLPHSIDLLQALRRTRQSTLEGVVLTFSGVMSKDEHRHPLEKAAISYGALVQREFTDAVTHVVAAIMDTEKIFKASLSRSCVAVHVDWLMFSIWHCRRESEEIFSLLPRPARIGFSVA